MTAINWSQYLLESSFCLIIFYAFYFLFLKKETFFQLNRIYLLLTPLASLSIPLFNIKLMAETTSASIPVYFPIVKMASNAEQTFVEQIAQPTPIFTLTIGDLFLTIYLLGMLLMGVKLLLNLKALYKVIHKGQKEKFQKHTMIDSEGAFPAASFFSYIFWDHSNIDKEKNLILEHEMVHIKQWHSVDVLLMELMVVVKWFNPLIHLFRKSLRVTHEFIADQYVVENHQTSKYNYAKMLLGVQASTSTSLTNTFYSFTKMRLLMLGRKPSAQWKKMKYFLSIPLVGSLMLLFSFNLVEELPEDISSNWISFNSRIEGASKATIFEINEDENKLLSKAPNTIQLEWGDQKCDCKRYNTGYNGRGFYQCPSISLTEEKYHYLLKQKLKFYENGKRIPLKQFTSGSDALFFKGDKYLPHGKALKKFTDDKAYFHAVKKGDHLGLRIYLEGNKFLNVELALGDENDIVNTTAYELQWGNYSTILSKERVNLKLDYGDWQEEFSNLFRVVKKGSIPVTIQTLIVENRTNKKIITINATENLVSNEAFQKMMKRFYLSVSSIYITLKTTEGDFPFSITLENIPKEAMVNRVRQPKGDSLYLDAYHKYYLQIGEEIASFASQEFTFDWGGESIKGQQILSLSQFKKLIKKELMVSRNGERVKIKSFDLTRTKETPRPNTSTPINSCYVGNYLMAFNKEVSCYMDVLKSAKKGDTYFFRKMELVDGTKNIAMVIKIKSKRVTEIYPPKTYVISWGDKIFKYPYNILSGWYRNQFYEKIPLTEFKKNFQKKLRISLDEKNIKLVSFDIMTEMKGKKYIQHYEKVNRNIKSPNEVRFQSFLQKVEKEERVGFNFKLENGEEFLLMITVE